MCKFRVVIQMTKL